MEKVYSAVNKEIAEDELFDLEEIWGQNILWALKVESATGNTYPSIFSTPNLSDRV